MTARRYEKAGDALAEVHQGYDRWTGGLSNRSVEAAFGVLAAHWAVYKSTEAILSSWLATLSIVVVVCFLVTNLLLSSFMTGMYGDRCDYADADKARWANEFDAAGKAKRDPWPYTRAIERLGVFLRWMRTWAPIVAGILFLVSLKTHG